MEDLQSSYSIHDAIIVATSEILGANTITKDEVIKENKNVERVW